MASGQRDEQQDEQRERVSWLAITAAALAAMSSAFVLSTLGVGGTVIGAALGSIVASLSTAVYGRGLRRGTDVIKAQARVPAGRAAEAEELADAGIDPESIEDDQGKDEAKSETKPAISWKRVAVVAAGLFVAVMIGITAIELLAGESFSQITGGSNDRRTTVGVGHEKSSSEPSSTPTGTPSSSPSQSASQSPSSTPSESATATPTETPTAESTETPTETPTAEPTETATTETSPIE
ncbi:MAG: hypothetical protein QM655_01825 [Nocardioidaceae bacterium]